MNFSLSYENPTELHQQIKDILRNTLNAPIFPTLHTPLQDAPYELSPNDCYHAFPEILFQLSGSNQFTCGHNSFLLKAGEICIMPAGVPHTEKGKGTDFSGFVIAHDARRVGIYGSACNDGGVPWPIPIDKVIPLSDGTKLAGILNEAALQFSHHSDAAPYLLRAYLTLILEIYDKPIPESAQKYPPLITRCMDLLFSELGSPNISLESIALRLNCKPNTLSKNFSRATGKAVIEHLTELRIEQARKLLKESTLTIAEVGWACGYRDQNYFSRIFKNETGSTPRNYRKGL